MSARSPSRPTNRGLRGGRPPRIGTPPLPTDDPALYCHAADYRTWNHRHSESLHQTEGPPVTDEPVTSLDRDADVVTVALQGEVDVLNVDQVRIALVEALETRPRALVVDLEKLS